MSARSFTASAGTVLLSGVALTDHRVEDLLSQFEAAAREAERAADDARRAYNELWDARCAAIDFRQNRARAA